MPDKLPEDPWTFSWPNTCRTCFEDALVNWRGYCSVDCENEDVLSGWTDERNSNGVEVGEGP
jgi:hypothetical protein